MGLVRIRPDPPRDFPGNHEQLGADSQSGLLGERPTDVKANAISFAEEPDDCTITRFAPHTDGQDPGLMCIRNPIEKIGRRVFPHDQDLAVHDGGCV